MRYTYHRPSDPTVELIRIRKISLENFLELWLEKVKSVIFSKFIAQNNIQTIKGVVVA